MAATQCTEKAGGQAVLLDFYGFSEQPFGVTPDPRFLYMTQSHREALASLIYAIETKRGFSALIAEPGMGKTSLLFYLLERLKPSARTAFLFRPDANAKELLQSLLIDLGLGTVPQDVPQMHETLTSVLLDGLHAGKQFVWVIDEAQDLEDEVLESVRLLSNFETPASKLMHIVLAGQTALSEKLARPELLQLRQRVSTQVHLEPLSSSETSDYIQHRIQRAGGKNRNLFTPESRDLMWEASQGIPRNINNLCFSCLSLGFVQRCKEIGPAIVRDAIADHDFTPQRQTQVAAQPPSFTAAPPDYSVPEPDMRFSEPEMRYGMSRWPRSFALLGFVVIPFLLVVLESSSRGGVLESFGGPVGAKIIGGVTGYDISVPDFPAVHSASLRPPAPPDRLMVKTERSDVPETDATHNRPEVIPSKGENHRGYRNSGASASQVVYARKGQTLNMLAFNYYGKSNETIIEQIRRHNPQIKDVSMIFKQDQPVVLPDLAPQYPWKGGRGYARN